jgi:sec-independent protein translocase protein TatB
MLDIGWTEMLVIAVVAVVVIGPKELPRALRTAGQMLGKARGLARDFQRHIDDMVRESELDELRKKAGAIQNYDPSGLLDDDADPTGGKPGDDKSGGGAAEPAKPSIAPAHSLGDEHGKTAETTTTTAEDAPKAATGGG